MDFGSRNLNKGCRRCNNEKYQGDYPYCERCHLCDVCQGGGYDLGRMRICGRCSGRGFFVDPPVDEASLESSDTLQEIPK